MFTLDDLALALQRPIDPDDEAYYQYLIDSVTAFLETETGIAFSRHENETLRYRADGRGIIELIGPVESVAVIAPLIQSQYTYRYDGWYWQPALWDGLGDIDGLAPYEVVDVTYTYGYRQDEIPEDIRAVAIDAVIGVITGRTPDDLTEKTVGDITYRWADLEITLDSMSASVLSAYRGVGKTWRL